MAWSSSETCAFELIEAEFVRDVEPGEMVVIDKTGMRSVRPFAAQRAAPLHLRVGLLRAPRLDHRRPLGLRGARAHGPAAGASSTPVAADVVIPVPDSGVAAAIGYARESGIPFDQGLMRSHYVGRTFIEPSQQIRHFGVKLKLSPVREVLAGKRVVVVDDSIVRGTTSRKIVAMIRGAGAREVHMRISSPPTVGPCRYGIDTPTREELIALATALEEIRRLRRRRLARLPVARGAARGRERRGPVSTKRTVARAAFATPASRNAIRSRWSSRPVCASCG